MALKPWERDWSTAQPSADTQKPPAPAISAPKPWERDWSSSQPVKADMGKTAIPEQPKPQASLGGVLKDVGRAIYDIPVQTMGAIGAAVEGKDPYSEHTWSDDFVAKAKQRTQERRALPGGEEEIGFGITRQDVRDLPANLGFSLTSAGAGLGAGLPVAALPVPGARPAAWAAGGAASGAAAYNMAANQFVRDVIDSAEQEQGRPLSQQEKLDLQNKFSDAASEYGLWEAIPEAVGNVAGLKIIASPLKGALGKAFGKNLGTRILGKMSALYGTELGTETVTQMGQHNVEVDTGQAQGERRSFTSPGDYYESLKEVAPQVFLLTTVMGGVGGAGVKVYEKTVTEPQQSLALQRAAASGQFRHLSDEDLDSFIVNSEKLAAKRKNDKGLQSAVDALKKEKQYRDTGGQQYEAPVGPYDAQDIESRPSPPQALPAPDRTLYTSKAGQTFNRDQLRERGFIGQTPSGERFDVLRPDKQAISTEQPVSTEGDVTQAEAVKPAEIEQTTIDEPNGGLFVKHGDIVFNVNSIEDASRKWEKYRDATGAGVSEIGNGLPIMDANGNEVARISYNGRVWPPGERVAGTKPIFTPESEIKPIAPDADALTQIGHEVGQAERRGVPAAEGSEGVQPGGQEEALIQAARTQPTFDKFSSYVRGRFSREQHRQMADSGELEQAWNQAHGENVSRETIPPDLIYRKTDGKPFPSEKAAKMAARARKIEAEPVVVDGGFALRERVENQPDNRQEYTGPERRKDTNTRRRVNQMTPDEMRAELLVDPMTGLGNRRAYEEADRLPVQASVDVDALKWVNDNMGHESGDHLIQLMGEALAKHTDRAYHISGDEFVVETQTQDEADAILASVADELRSATITAEHDGTVYTKTGVEFSYGTGETLKSADAAIRKSKSDREAAGLRPARGEKPAGVAEKPAEGREDNRGKAEEVEEPLFQMVFHGTPHRFDKFSLDAIGTGEGAQAYGWGLYFASKREVGDFYREQLSFYGSGYEHANVSDAAKEFLSKVIEGSEQLLRTVPDSEAKKFISSRIEEERRTIKFAIDEHRKTFDEDAPDTIRARYRAATEALESVNSLPKGNLYQASIPEDSELLDWDKPLNEQPDAVRDKIAAAVRDVAEQIKRADIEKDYAYFKSSDAYSDAFAEQFKRDRERVGAFDFLEDFLRQRSEQTSGLFGDYSVSQGGAFYRYLVDREGSDRAASEYLNAIGIPGLRYLDATSRSEGDGTHNYVIWDENAVTIEAVNDELLQAAERDIAEKYQIDTAPDKVEGLRANQIRMSVNRLTKAWSDVVKIEVVQRQSELPKAVTKRYEALAEQGKKAIVRGIFMPTENKVYLVADNIADIKQAHKTLFHEVLGHYGLRVAFGGKLNNLLDQVAESHPDRISEIARTYGYDLSNPKQRLNAAEEVLARMAEKNENPGLLVRVYAAIRRWARNLGVNLKLSNAELRTIVATARRAVIEGMDARAKVSARRSMAGAEPAFDIADEAGANPDEVEDARKEWEEKGTDSKYFKRWFGDSKVVDDDGNPLVVYHGTKARIQSFKPGKDGGIYFTDSRDEAKEFAEWYGGTVSGNPSVQSVYLSIENPLVVDADGELFEPAMTDLYIEEAKSGGHDGVIVRNIQNFEGGIASDTYIAFESAQIKSTTDNRGTFSPDDTNILFDMDAAEENASDPLNFPNLSRSAKEHIFDLVHSDKQVSWWDKSVGTMRNLAKKNEHFAKVYREAEDFINDASRFALGPEAKAKDWFRQMGSIKEVLTTGNASNADLAKVSQALFEGTIKDNVVYTDESLRTRFGLNSKQIRYYRQAVDAVHESLDGLSKTIMHNIARKVGVSRELADGAIDDGRTVGEVKENFDAIINSVLDAKKEEVSALEQAMTDLVKDGNRERIAETQKKLDKKRKAVEVLEEAIADLQDTYNKNKKLKDNGYFPLMRFGEYTVDVVAENGDRLYFSMFEKEAEANKMARAMKQLYPEATVTKGIQNDIAWRKYRGLTPDTIEIFAKHLQIDDHEAMQAYLQKAVANRSALKRLIHRKNIPGFSQDVRRVLSSFIISNSRASSSNIHMGYLEKAVDAIPREQGDVEKQAQKLKEYLTDPREEFGGLRNFLFFNFLGGSIASAMTNLTQVPMVTIPYLTQFDARAPLIVAKWASSWNDPSDPQHRAALQRAKEEGVVSPQEIYNLMATARGGVLGKGRVLQSRGVQTALYAWGSMFSMAEQYNRVLTFNAAYDIASRKGMADPYAFAKEAVEETQFVYNKANRPNWARGIGAPLFTFKQFTINYLEFLRRLPTPQKAIAVSLLVLASGIQGLPFEEDLEDLLDAFGQWTGIGPTNTRLSIERWALNTLGETFGNFLLRGVSGIEGVPLDVQARLGLGNLIPMTGALKQSTQDKGRDVVEFFGAGGAVASNVARASGYLAKGEVGTAAYLVSPRAIQAASQAITMFQTGEYKDIEGRKIVDTDLADAFIKLGGFHPTSVSRVQRTKYMLMENINLQRVKEDGFADRMATAAMEGDKEAQKKVMDEIKDWNERHPDVPVRITRRQIQQRIKERRQSATDRFIRRTPKEMRGLVSGHLR